MYEQYKPYQTELSDKDLIFVKFHAEHNYPHQESINIRRNSAKIQLYKVRRFIEDKPKYASDFELVIEYLEGLIAHLGANNGQ